MKETLIIFHLIWHNCLFLWECYAAVNERTILGLLLDLRNVNVCKLKTESKGLLGPVRWN